jgi:mevalonate kinase
MFSLLIALVSILSISRKIRHIEKTQIHDIDDVIGFNNLINEELGMMKAKQDELIKLINSSKHKISKSTGAGSEGKLFNNAPYSQAVQLARRGYAREDIISLCSLTESEAELILALHSNSKAA